MAAVLVMVTNVRFDELDKMMLTEDYHVVKQLSA
jgi:hypothetical protein